MSVDYATIVTAIIITSTQCATLSNTKSGFPLSLPLYPNLLSVNHTIIIHYILLLNSSPRAPIHTLVYVIVSCYLQGLVVLHCMLETGGACQDLSGANSTKR
jgi:hypothetical protein